MAWITTDMDVACTLTVSKTVDGQSIIGYPRQYSLLDAFGDFAAITVDDWHKAASDPRLARISAFVSYVNHLEEMDVDADQTNEIFRPSTETPGRVVG